MPPSSASTLSNSLLGPVTLPLFKLSHCTISGPGARMLWTHLPNRDDMFAVFDETRSRDLGGSIVTKQVLKLVRGGELFETVDFDSLRYQARLDQQRAQSQSIPDELLYVVVVVKRPLLALRYRLPDGQIRRLQMNFQPPSGCDTALDILKPLGLPMRIRQENEPPRPSMQRPYSSQSVVTTSPSRSQESKINVVGPYEDIPPSVQPAQAYSRPNSSADGNNPDTFSKPISYIRDPRIQQQQTPSVIGGEVGYDRITRPNSSSIDLGLTDQTRMKPPTLRRLLPSPTFSNQSSYLGGYDTRPISAPEPRPLDYLTDSVPLSQMMPPVRELPFPEKPIIRDPRAVPTTTDPIPDRPTSTRAPQPKRRRAPAKPKTSRSSSIPGSSAPKARTKKATGAKVGSDKVPPSTAPPESRSAVQAYSDEAPPSSAPPQTSTTLEALEQTVSKMSKNFTPPPSRSGNEASKKRPLSAISDSETNRKQPPPLPDKEPIPSAQQQPAQPSNPVLSNINSAEFLNSLDNWIRKYHDLPAPQAPVTIAKDQLVEYASKSDEERAKIIDNMICECLQDENFGKLVDDLEGHWKRICLGF